MKKRNKIGCFILSRLSSSRLPGKALMEIRGKPIVQHIIERARLIPSSQVVALCTSAEKSDDPLALTAKKCGADVYRGPLSDILKRFLGAADKFGVDYFAIFSGDNLFCDPHLAELGIKQMLDNELDFLNVAPDLVCGGTPYCVSVKALRKACQLKSDDNTEYYPKFFNGNKEFKVANHLVDDPFYHNKNVRLTMDYPEDLKFVKRIFDEFDTDYNSMPLKKILELLKQKPEIVKINFVRHKDWAKNQIPMKVVGLVKK